MYGHNKLRGIHYFRQVESLCRDIALTVSILTHCNIASMSPNGAPYGALGGDTIVLENGVIAWIGGFDNLPVQYANSEVINLGGRLVTPALIDCHTHLIFGGHRAKEFEMRLNGASYEEIARAGGGIISTVTATRDASENELVKSALPRIDVLIAEGVTTLEIKSGYGLNADVELRMLRAARRLEKLRAVTIKTTYLGAHAAPPEYTGRDDAYIDEVCIPTLRHAHAEGLVDSVDAFCEGIAFTPTQVARVFDVAVSLGLPVKIHAEQLSNLGGAKMAAGFAALSADHIEYLDEDGVAAMARSGTVAVILPGAFYTLRETQMPPVGLLRKHNVPMALATDANPGSSPMTSLLLAMNMAATLFRMTPQEALAGVTRNAAKALGLTDRGEIALGFRADLAVWDVEIPAELSYRIGFNPLHMRIYGGQL
jgi:imidazolonepropionase